MFIFSFGGASVTIPRKRVTTLSYSILTTQWIHVRGFLLAWNNTSCHYTMV